MRKTLIWLFILVLLVLPLSMISTAQETEDTPEECYLSIYPGAYNYYPGEKPLITVDIYYYYLKEKGNIDEDFKLEIFDLTDIMKSNELENFLKKYSELEDTEKLVAELEEVETIEEEVELENDYGDYWYNYFDMELPSLSSGYYLLRGSTSRAETFSLLSVSSTGAITKHSQDETIVFVQNIKTGEPIAGAEIKIFDEYNLIKTLKTDEQGQTVFKHGEDIKEGDHITVFAIKDRDIALVEGSSYYHSEDFKGYIYTDRPIYRPEQDVKFKAILRYEDKEELTFAEKEDINVIITDPDGTEIYNEKLKTDEFGSISGTLTLGKEPALGYYSISCANKDDWTVYGDFQVEEYRKPEFEIILTPDKKQYIQKEKVTVEVEAKYYFGAPVSETEYSYEIYRDYYYPYIYRYWWEEDIRCCPYYYSYGGELINSGTGRTDKEGKSKITFKTEKLDYDVSYRVIVKMVDESRREVSSSSASRVTRGAFYLDIETDRYYCEPDEKVNIKVKAQDYSENPVETDIELVINYETYNDKKEEWQWEEVATKSLKTDKEGVCYFEFTPEEVGYYEIVCNSLDLKENVITGSDSLYCTSDDIWYDWHRFSGVEIIPDKDFYYPGEEANLFIVCPFDGIKALVTVEGDKIISREIMDFPNKTRNLKVKITEDCSPVFYVTVNFYCDGYFQYYQKNIPCPREDKFLTLEIKADKDKYKPRDTAKFIVETKDYKGNPVSAQVTLGVADESVYAIAGDSTSNMQKFFYGTRNSYIYTYSSDGGQHGGDYYYNYDYDYGPWDMKRSQAPPPPPSVMPSVNEMAEGDGFADSTAMVQPEFVRDYFPDTAYFNPSIITDQNGIAEVIFSVPDSLTTWRATARGVTKATEVGENTEKILVTKDLLARLITPRFLTERDETVITGIIHNYLSEDKTVRLKLETEGGIDMISEKELDLVVPADGSVPFDWKIKAVKTGDAVFTLTALTNEESDAVEMTIPVLPHGTEKYVAISGSTKEGTVEEELNLPDDASETSSRCVIKLDPSLASSIFSSLEYLVGYPYGCTEQTMSRFLPNIIVSKTMGELDIYNEKINEELPDMMEKGLNRLYDYHHSDGGWGWWKNDESHPFMTAYVVYGLSLAKDAGYDIDNDVLKSGAEWLKENYDSQEDINTKAYMAFAATVAGEETDEWLTDLYKKEKKLDNYSKAVLALSLYKRGLAGKAGEMAAILENSADATGTSAFWPSKEDSYGWTDNTVETTAYVLKALVAIKPESKLIPKTVRFLSTSRRGEYWYTTKDTAAVVMAFTDYVKVSKEMSPDFTADVYFNGTKIKSCKFTKDDVGKAGVEIDIPFTEGLLPGKNDIKIEMTGKGVLYYAAYLKYYTEEETIKPEQSGVSVKKTYYIIETDKDGNEKERKRLGSDGYIKVKPQDIIEVELKVSGAVDYEYLIIEDPKPAGCEITDKTTDNFYDYWSYWYTHREVRDEKIAFFSTYWWRGEQVLTYRMRAETPGVFHTMPAKAYLMYSPDIGGNSSEIILKIEE